LINISKAYEEGALTPRGSKGEKKKNPGAKELKSAES